MREKKSLPAVDSPFLHFLFHSSFPVRVLKGVSHITSLLPNAFPSDPLDFEEVFRGWFVKTWRGGAAFLQNSFQLLYNGLIICLQWFCPLRFCFLLRCQGPFLLMRRWNAVISADLSAITSDCSLLVWVLLTFWSEAVWKKFSHSICILNLLFYNHFFKFPVRWSGKYRERIINIRPPLAIDRPERGRLSGVAPT